LYVDVVTTLATCVPGAEPDGAPKAVTTQLSDPVLVGGDVTVTVSVIVDAPTVTAVTSPVAPRVKATVLPAGVGSKLRPVTEIFAAFFATLVVVVLTTGLGTSVAIWTGAPLETPKEVIARVRLPGLAGRTLKVSVSEVEVAEETEATPSLRTATLPAAVGSKPEPSTASVPEGRAMA